MYNRLNDEISLDENSAGGTKTEMADLSPAQISGGYGSTPVTVHQILHIPFCGLIFYIMAFFSFFCALMLRESLNVAIVAMVNHTAAIEMDIMIINVSSQEQCPRDPELQHESGEFNWNRNQQGILLAAFYYGYVVTQVCSIRTCLECGTVWVYYITRNLLICVGYVTVMDVFQ